MSEVLIDIIEKEMVSVEGEQLIPKRGRANDLLGQVGRMMVNDQTSFAKAGDLVKILTTDVKSLNESKLETTKKPREYVSWVNAEFKKITEPLEAGIKAAKKKMKIWADAEEKKRQELAENARKKAEAEALVLAEKAEKDRKEAEERERVAQEARDQAKRDGDKAAEEKAAQEASEAAQEASEHGDKAEEIMEAAANAPPPVDTTVRKAKGSYGATTGMRKDWKCEVVSLSLFMTEAEDYLIKLVTNDPQVREAVRKAVQKAAIAKVQSAIAIAGKEAKDASIPGLKVFQESDVNIR